MTGGVAMALSPGFLESIGREFPVDFASIDPSDLATYGRDWTAAFPPRASILCRPRTTDEVSRLMKLCAQHRVPVVPSGGRTGLACGALATRGERNLSLERMRGMEPVESEFWTYRTSINMSLSDAGFIHRHIVSLPLSRLCRGVSRTEHHYQRRFAAHAAQLFSHFDRKRAAQDCDRERCSLRGSSATFSPTGRCRRATSSRISAT